MSLSLSPVPSVRYGFGALSLSPARSGHFLCAEPVIITFAFRRLGVSGRGAFRCEPAVDPQHGVLLGAAGPWASAGGAAWAEKSVRITSAGAGCWRWAAGLLARRALRRWAAGPLAAGAGPLGRWAAGAGPWAPAAGGGLLACAGCEASGNAPLLGAVCSDGQRSASTAFCKITPWDASARSLRHDFVIFTQKRFSPCFESTVLGKRFGKLFGVLVWPRFWFNIFGSVWAFVVLQLSAFPLLAHLHFWPVFRSDPSSSRPSSLLALML